MKTALRCHVLFAPRTQKIKRFAKLKQHTSFTYTMGFHHPSFHSPVCHSRLLSRKTEIPLGDSEQELPKNCRHRMFTSLLAAAQTPHPTIIVAVNYPSKGYAVERGDNGANTRVLAQTNVKTWRQRNVQYDTIYYTESP